MFSLLSHLPARAPHSVGINRQKAIWCEREMADERELHMGRHHVAAQKYRDVNQDTINVHVCAQ